MEVQVNIGLEQLIKIVKELPEKQLNQLMAEINKVRTNRPSNSLLEDLLLNGPVATKKQLETIENNRNDLNQWRIR